MTAADAVLAAPFTSTELAGRQERVARATVSAGLDALLVTIPENIYYLTGFSTPSYYTTQALLIRPGERPFLFTYASEADGIARTTDIDDFVVYGPGQEPMEVLADALAARRLGGARLGFELRSFFFPVASYLALVDRLPHIKASDATPILESIRAVKSDAELAYICEAADVASAAMRAVRAEIRDGATENDLAAAAYATAIRAGGDFPGSPPYVSTGWRTTLPHATWARRTIQPNDLVYTELSGCVRRYSAALMRTFSLGELPDQLARLEQAIILGLEAAIDALRPGVRSGDVDAACRAPIRDAGYEYPHETGYSIGVCYPPGWNETHVFNLKPGDEREVKANMVFHLVPHVIVQDLGTVGLSETVLVAAEETRVLTQFPRHVVLLEH